MLKTDRNSTGHRSSHTLLDARRRAERHVADDLQLEAFERGDLRRVVRQEQDAAQAKLVQYLRADAVVAVFAVAGLDRRLLLRQPLLLHELVSAELVHEVEVVVALAQVEDDAPALGGDALQ